MFEKLINFTLKNRFDNSADYWERRYKKGGNSGPGSYGALAKFKAEIVNDFVKDHNITSVVELGCGDGNQLLLSNYPLYTGYDVSPHAIHTCRQRFLNDKNKRFLPMADWQEDNADLALSMDVIFHLVEDDVFETYMQKLFKSSNQFVAIYSSNSAESLQPKAQHVRHRKFSDWIDDNATTWSLLKHIPNQFPDNGDYLTTSFSEFYFYKYLVDN